MNLKTVRELDTLTLQGIKFEWIKEDDTPRELRLTDESGHNMVIRGDSHYSTGLRILIEVPEEKTK